MSAQYSSALGPFEGGIHFNREANVGLLKSMAFSRCARDGVVLSLRCTC